VNAIARRVSKLERIGAQIHSAGDTALRVRYAREATTRGLCRRTPSRRGKATAAVFTRVVGHGQL
jgi:hypothetical protein